MPHIELSRDSKSIIADQLSPADLAVNDEGTVFMRVTNGMVDLAAGEYTSLEAQASRVFTKLVPGERVTLVIPRP